MEGGGAYGAGKAGSAFDPIAFIKRPQVILRIVSWIFAIIVFGCISAEGYYNNQCMYNGDENACNFGIAIGVLAFLACMVFLVTDAVMDQISSVEYRKYIVMADLGFSAFWTFMWFVCFCYLADTWRKSPTMPYGSDEVQAAIAFSFFSIISWVNNLITFDENPQPILKLVCFWTFMWFVCFCYLTNKWTTFDNPPPDFPDSGVEAAIAFSFFSILTWAGLTALAVMRFRQGSAQAFSQGYEPDMAGPDSSPYTSYPTGGDASQESYQEPPFSGGSATGESEYKPPTY